MKRVVITRSNFVDPDSRVEKEVLTLIQNGYDVTLVVWNRGENYIKRIDEKVINNINVKRISFGAKARFGEGLKSIIPFLRFQISLFIWLIMNINKYDVFHFCDFDTAFIGSKVCKITKKRYIFDIFDYLSTEANSLFSKIIEKLENNIINNSFATIICTEERKLQIKKANARKIVVIHNTPSQIFVPIENIKINDNDKIKIVYVGILQDYRLIKELINVICEMSNVELHIAGFGKYENYIKDKSQNNENIIYYGKIQYMDTIALENKCDIITALYDPCIGNHLFAAPNKFYEALFLGKPILMVKNTGMSNIVLQENIGEIIDYNENSLKNGICKLISRKKEWPKMKIRMNQLYDEKYSWKIMEERLLSLYEDIQ